MQDTSLQIQSDLTPREQEIFDMLIEGISPKEIAFKLEISYHTVDFHRGKIYRKLDVKSIHEFLARYGSGKNGYAVQHLTFFERNRLRLLVPVGILLLAAAFFSGYYLAKKTTVIILPDEGEYCSLASEETPYVIRLTCNDPWGWHSKTTFPMFFENKITAGDIYTVLFTFKSDVALKSLIIALQDHTTGEEGQVVLFPHYEVLSDIKENTEYTIHTSMIATETASSTAPRANSFTIDAKSYTTVQPVLTFTRLDLMKHK